MYQPQNQNTARMAAPTSSQSLTKTMNGSHKFVIRGYSLAKGMGVGKHIASDTFTVGGYQWAIYFYPDGKNPEDNSAYVSVFIALASEGTDVRALFELTLLDQSGNARHKVHSHFDRLLESGPYTLKYRGSMWGYKRFFRRVMLETSDFLKDDCLKINCTVGVVVSEVDCPTVQPLKVPEPDMGSEFAMFLDSGEGADVTFDVSGEKFRAHKIILAARSPILQAAFSDVMDKEEHEVFITDMEPNVFRALLHYIYKDDLDEEANEPSNDSCEQPAITEKKEAKLLAAADRYGLPRLRVICESRLCKDITVDNVATMLALAERHHAAQLKAVCLEFAAENLIAVMRSDGFQCFKENFPHVQSELLRAVAGFEAQFIVGGQHHGMWAQLADREETHAGVVRQLTLENIEASTHTESVWIGVSNSRRDSAGNPPPKQ